jgi:erythromycin esterase-like protein
MEIRLNIPSRQTYRKSRLTRVYLLMVLFFTAYAAGAQPEQQGWSMLESKIGNNTIVGLGEQGHGFASLNKAKSIVLDHLRTALGFNVVLVEGSFNECVVSYLNHDSLSGRLHSFIYPFWNTVPVQQALLPFCQQEVLEGRMKIAGFDPQEDCRFTGLSRYLIRNGIITANKQKLEECDSLLSRYIGKPSGKKGILTTTEYALLREHYQAVAEEIRTGTLTSGRQLLLRCMENRQWLCKYLTIKDVRDRIQFRDSLMAENVIWLKQHLFARDKIILWAADLHLSKPGRKPGAPEFMGEWLYPYIGEVYFNISFQNKKAGNSNTLDEELSIRYAMDPTVPFSATISPDKMVKIKAEEWQGPCN